MSNANHTEGPWKLVPADDTPGHREPAFVYAGDQRWANTSRTSRNVDADARLIAAAPDLLEALLEAKAEMRDWGPDHPAMRQIDAAIAKATGAS